MRETTEKVESRRVKNTYEYIQGFLRVMVVRGGYDSSSHSKTEILYTHMLVFALFRCKLRLKYVWRQAVLGDPPCHHHRDHGDGGAT